MSIEFPKSDKIPESVYRKMFAQYLTDVDIDRILVDAVCSTLASRKEVETALQQCVHLALNCSKEERYEILEGEGVDIVALDALRTKQTMEHRRSTSSHVTKSGCSPVLLLVVTALTFLGVVAYASN